MLGKMFIVVICLLLIHGTTTSSTNDRARCSTCTNCLRLFDQRQACYQLWTRDACVGANAAPGADKHIWCGPQENETDEDIQPTAAAGGDDTDDDVTPTTEAADDNIDEPATTAAAEEEETTAPPTTAAEEEEEQTTVPVDEDPVTTAPATDDTSTYVLPPHKLTPQQIGLCNERRCQECLVMIGSKGLCHHQWERPICIAGKPPGFYEGQDADQQIWCGGYGTTTTSTTTTTTTTKDPPPKIEIVTTTTTTTAAPETTTPEDPASSPNEAPSCGACKGCLILAGTQETCRTNLSRMSCDYLISNPTSFGKTGALWCNGAAPKTNKKPPLRGKYF